MELDFWTLNAFPIVSLILAVIGYAVIWTAGRRFDKKYGKDGIPPK